MMRVSLADRMTAMRIAYLDCFSGISGDMFMGALLDAEPALAGVLEKTVTALNIGARLNISKVNRSGIHATKVDVIVHEDVAQPPSAALHQHARGLKEIREIIAASDISDAAKQTATRIFETLGAAEAKIHDIPVEQVHFHEVGAVDAIVDIVCAAVGADALRVDEWVCSPLNVGGGTVTCAHGRFPVPAPATVELLQGAPVYSSGLEAELVTPTGAAIVSVLANRFASFPAMQVAASGYGAGTQEFPRHANVLRITVGELTQAIRNSQLAIGDTAAHPSPIAQRQSPIAEGASIGNAAAAEETVVVLEATLDDMTPQIFGYVMERALAAGALEVFGTPVRMKKSRPGTMLTVLARPEDASRLAQLVFAETTTLGVRMREERRRCLARRHVAVPTRWGEVRMKVASLNGTVTNCVPEYEDCRRLAAEHHIPLKTVMQEAVRSYLAEKEHE